jgi:hypothetical protein
MKDMESLAKRIKQNTLSLSDFSKQFILEVKSVVKTGRRMQNSEMFIRRAEYG